MNDGGIDADSFSSTMEYLMNAPSNNGMCPIQGGPIDLGLPYENIGNDRRIEGYDPEIRDSEESSDEEAAGASVSRDIKQASGNFSNAFIEECWSEGCSGENSKPAVPKVQLKKSYDQLRESANAKSLQTNRLNPISAPAPLQERREENKEAPKTNKSHNVTPKKKRLKFKNVAIESLLDIKKASEEVPTESAVVSSSTTVEAFVNGVEPAVVNGINSTRRGRGRFSENSLPNNISMIRQECISGYDVDPDYNPNNPRRKSIPARVEFPSL